MNSYDKNVMERIISTVLEGKKQYKSYSAFENWAQYGVTPEQYVAVLPWLFDNDRNDLNQTVKGIGLVVPHEWVEGDELGLKMLFKQTGPAEIHKIKYVLSYSGDVTSLYDKDTGYAWWSNNPRYTIEDVVRGVMISITEKA